MLRDIFVDNCIAKNFCNPQDPEYLKLYKWLLAYDPRLGDKNAHLVLSKKILNEYCETCSASGSNSSIWVIVDRVTRQGRRVNISNEQIKDFKKRYFKGRALRNLRCSTRDRDHLPAVLLSDRKFALSRDREFVYDINNFPGFTARAARRPQNLPYDI